MLSKFIRFRMNWFEVLGGDCFCRRVVMVILIIKIRKMKSIGIFLWLFVIFMCWYFVFRGELDVWVVFWFCNEKWRKVFFCLCLFIVFFFLNKMVRNYDIKLFKILLLCYILFYVFSILKYEIILYLIVRLNLLFWFVYCFIVVVILNF